MSSAEPIHPDAKNSITNFPDSRHSELAKNPEMIRNGSFILQDERNKKHFSHVMCFGTFDIFHPGHQFYLSEASKLADHMTVVIARDHRVFSGKGRDPVHTELFRRDIVERAFPDASVILGNESDIFAPIRELHPDLLAFGYDQRVPEERIRELFPNIEIQRIGGYEVKKYKSSIIRETIENNTENILLVPGTGQSVKNYGNYNGLDIWTEPLLRNHTESTDYLIGHSLGATYALTHSTNPDCKFILINPLVQKRNFLTLFISWIRFLLFEGFDIKKAILSRYWFYTFRYAYTLSRIDILPLLTKIPKENLHIIRGRGDRFFCDDIALTIAKKHGLNIIEVDSGHDWNKNIAEAVEQVL